MAEVARETDDPQVQADIAAEDDRHPGWWPRHPHDHSPVDPRDT